MSEDTSEVLLKHMDSHGIDMALIYPGAFMCRNDEIAKVVARAPKNIGFAKCCKYMPPFSSPQEEKLAMDDLEHGLRDLGLATRAASRRHEALPDLRDLPDIFSAGEFVGPCGLADRPPSVVIDRFHQLVAVVRPRDLNWQVWQRASGNDDHVVSVLDCDAVALGKDARPVGDQDLEREPSPSGELAWNSPAGS
jgi:hypothetical protein